MLPPSRVRLDARRQHFQHGPIDLIIEASGVEGDVRAALERAWRRFEGVLQELVDELNVLRAPMPPGSPPRGRVARRMVVACEHFSDVFITPMAAVAGAVADEILEAMTSAPGISRAYVNNGGDIALHLEQGERYRVGLVADPSLPLRHGHVLSLDGNFEIHSDMPVRGVATSGWRGRSWSFGIADSVTVLSKHAAGADAAATMVANAVDVDHAAIVRRPACEVDDNTDLGSRLVTVDVAALPGGAVEEALERGARCAEELRSRNLIWGAVMVLQSRVRVIGGRLGTDRGARGMVTEDRMGESLAAQPG